MSDNLDKELDEIIDLIIKDYSAPPVGQGRPVSGQSARARKKAKCRFRGKVLRWIVLAVVVTVLVLSMIMVLRSCGHRGDALMGTWDLDGTTVYQFDGNGEGAMILPGKSYAFRYSINEETGTVSIDFEDERATDYTYDYQVISSKEHSLVMKTSGVLFFRNPLVARSMSCSHTTCRMWLAIRERAIFLTM